MTTHYKNARHPRYPNTACGHSGISIESSNDIEKVDCAMCIKSYNRHLNPIEIIPRKGRGFNKHGVPKEVIK